jgi:hypothetical protein
LDTLIEKTILAMRSCESDINVFMQKFFPKG